MRTIRFASALMAAILPLSYFSVSVFSSLVALNISQPYRPILLVAQITFALLAFRGITDVSSSPDYASVLGLFLLIWTSHMASVLCVEKLTLVKTSIWDWRAAYKMLFNGRRVGLKNQVSVRARRNSAVNVTASSGNQILGPESPGKHREMSYRRIFLFRRLLSALIIYVTYHFYTQIFHTFRPLDFSDFSPSKQSYIRRLHVITVRESLVRSWMVFHFVWSAWAIFTGLHDILAIIAVGSGLDDPADWPPLYGSPCQMYTIRRFWGKFWHRLVYRHSTAFGLLISEKILRLRRGSALEQLFVNFSVFLLSGVVHALVTLQLGFRCGYWEDVSWFCLNFVAMLVEERVQWAFGKLGGWTRNQALGKGVGMVWVFGFFFWSLPKTQYPKIYCDTG